MAFRGQGSGGDICFYCDALETARCERCNIPLCFEHENLYCEDCTRGLSDVEHEELVAIDQQSHKRMMNAAKAATLGVVGLTASFLFAAANVGGGGALFVVGGLLTLGGSIIALQGDRTPQSHKLQQVAEARKKYLSKKVIRALPPATSNDPDEP